MESVRKFEEILMYLSVLRYIFKSRSKRGLYDLNKKAEPFFRDLLNTVFSLQLIDMNEIQKNYPAIDLGDSANSICIQVTAENTSSKIKKTIEKFKKKKLYSEYGKLVIFILTEKKSYTTEFDTGDEFIFDKTKDIWDIDDVLEEIEKKNIDSLQEIHSFLSKELSSIIKLFAKKESLLSQVEESKGVEPTVSDAFFDYLEFDDDEKKDGQEDLLDLYGNLLSLSKRSREYLFVLADRSKEQSSAGYDYLYVLPADIESYTGLTRNENREEFQILESNNLVYFESDDYPPRIEIRKSMQFGVDLFLMLKSYLNDKGKLKRLIVDCDFSVLNA